MCSHGTKIVIDAPYDDTIINRVGGATEAFFVVVLTQPIAGCSF